MKTHAVREREKMLKIQREKRDTERFAKIEKGRT
jgi:hypothetical protein